MKLDAKDRLIVSALSRHGRLSNRELARRVGLSPSGCHARVRRLESAGVIVGYRAIIAHTGSGSLIEGWADIRLLDPTPALIDAFVELVESAPEIIEAHRIAGHWDYLVRFCAGDLSAWTDFRRRLEALECIVQSRFSILIEPLK